VSQVTWRAVQPGWRPGREWYALAAVVAVLTCAVTSVLAYGWVTDLVDQVDGFARVDAPGSAVVPVAEAGRYGVYHEYLDPSAAPGPGPDVADVGLTVTGPDGAPVEVHPSDVTYGWGSRRAVAVGEFDATRPGDYVVSATGFGRLAVGERVPGGVLRGFVVPTVVGALVLLACLVVSLVVAVQRRRVPEDVALPADGGGGTGVLPAPSPEHVRQALAPWEPGVTLSTDAVRTSGTAFAVSVDGGCVFGSVHDGVVDVEVGGYVNDGGCLASYGH
jgi:hypothetical protein